MGWSEGRGRRRVPAAQLARPLQELLPRPAIGPLLRGQYQFEDQLIVDCDERGTRRRRLWLPAARALRHALWLPAGGRVWRGGSQVRALHRPFHHPKYQQKGRHHDEHNQQ